MDTAALPARDEGRAVPLAALLVALALHAGGIALVNVREPADMTSPGEQFVTIDLAPAMTETPTLAPAETAQPLVTEAETISPTPTEAKPIETPPDAIAPVAPGATAPASHDGVAVIGSQASEETIAATGASLTAPTEMAAMVPPEVAKAKRPAAPRKPDPKAAEKPRAKTAARATTSLPSTPRSGQASSSRLDTRASAASADLDATNRYAAEVRAAVRRRLRYPASAQARGIKGVATIRFTLDRNGQVLGASLLRSAGDAAIDRAALATVMPGSTLPAAPPGIAGQRITIVAPLSFGLR